MTDVVLSFMAVKALEGFGDPGPVLLTVPGYVAPGGVNPSWGRILDPMRDSEGRVLTGLLERYQRFIGVAPDEVQHVAAVGFSAGANNGLRNLLRHPDDRARIDAVFSIDGLHPNIRHAVDPLAADAFDAIIDWKKDMGPFEAFATDAAKGNGLAVWTASDITINNTQVASTKDALRLLVRAVAEAAPASGRTAPELDDPPADAAVQLGNFLAYWFTGNDAEAHRRQARKVLPELLHRFLLPRWYPQIAAQPPATTPVALVELPARELPEARNPRMSRFAAAVPILATLGGVAAAAFQAA